MRYSIKFLKNFLKKFSGLEIIQPGYDLSERRKDCRLDGVPVDKLGDGGSIGMFI